MIAHQDNPSFEVEPEEAMASITRSIMLHAAGIARECDADAILLYLDALKGWPPRLQHERGVRVFYVTHSPHAYSELEKDSDYVIRLPRVPFNRTEQIRLSTLFAVSRGLLAEGDVVVCLTGVPGSGVIDTVVVQTVGPEYADYPLMENRGSVQNGAIAPHVLEQVLDVAIELATEGREGHPIGGLFVVGDTQKVLEFSRPLILNPFQGHPEEARNILDPALRGTVKELSLIDGAFIIRGDGVVVAAGAYLQAEGDHDVEVAPGLGARHYAAAAITAVTQAVAVVISESTGTVTLFRSGRVLTEIERPKTLNKRVF